MKTEYSLSKHRFYELKHFCLQYPEWKHLYLDLDGWGKGDTTSRDGIKRADIRKNLDLIEYCAMITNCDILQYVTESIPVPVDMRYYYLWFFWELSRRRG